MRPSERFAKVKFEAEGVYTQLESGMFGNGISFSYSDQASDNSSVENLTVEAPDKDLFLEALGMASLDGHDDRDLHLTFEGAAEYYWALLIEPLQR